MVTRGLGRGDVVIVFLVETRTGCKTPCPLLSRKVSRRLGNVVHVRLRSPGTSGRRHLAAWSTVVAYPVHVRRGDEASFLFLVQHQAKLGTILLRASITALPRRIGGTRPRSGG